MSPAERLASLVAGLDGVRLACLVLGGHAVRYYGLERHTNDFDLVVTPDGWDDLPARLEQTGLFAPGTVLEGNSWRPGAFRRFRIGTLPDGQDEWLEFWRENHLLAPFAELSARREAGLYGGSVLPFLGLPDLIRSKETERAKDWDDVSYLEEVLDARRRVRCAADPTLRPEALSGLRSRRGFDAWLVEGVVSDTDLVRAALAQATHPISQALLLPCAPDAVAATLTVALEPLVERKLREVQPASPLHYSLVEVVRRQYKLWCQARDRANKEAIRADQQP